MSNNIHTLTPESKQEEIDISQILGVLVDGRYFIIVIMLIAIIITVAIPQLSTPVYRADALIQLEKDKNSSFFPELMTNLPGAAPVSLSESTLIKSRSVLSQTVDEFDLDLGISEEKKSIWNKFSSLFSRGKKPTLKILQFDIPDYLQDKPFELTILAGEKYVLQSDNYQATGSIGKILNDNELNVFIEYTDAVAGTHFTIHKIDQVEAVEQLLKRLSVTDIGTNSGMLKLSLTGTDIKQIPGVLDSICNNYIRQNIARNSEVARKSLNFLQTQIPKIKKQLEESETALNSYREMNDSVDISMETKVLLDKSIANATQINELALEEASVSEKYTKGHPLYKALNEKQMMLNKKKKEIDSKINEMPKTQQNIMRLTRDVQTGNEIYMLLLSKQQELNITQASEIGNARIIDEAAVNYHPMKPAKSLLLIIGAMLGFIISSAILLIRCFLQRLVTTPEQLTQLGLTVYSEVPYVRRNKANASGLIVLKDPYHLTVEAIRSLRTSLYFTMKSSKNKIIMISGPDSGVGKSFISGNLAAVFSQSGLRVLLIDADMRLGHMHTQLEVSVGYGVSDILSGKKSIEECIVHTALEKLDFISRGSVPNNPSELLLGSSLASLLNYANDNYDLVLVDSPPLLRVADAIIIAKLTGTNLIISRFELTKLHEISATISRFEQAGCRINGVVLNAIKRRSSRSLRSKYYGYYGYGEEKRQP